MSKYQISKARLAEIIKEEYASIIEEKKQKLSKKQKDKMDVHPPPHGDGDIDGDDLEQLRKEQSEEDRTLDSIRDLIKQELTSLR
tara:strand:- start:534 stop:788 length:255 start_codon:yes stop_codon:yes gene_type:complete